MKLKEYIKSNFLSIIVVFISIFLLAMMMIAFKIRVQFMIAIFFIIILMLLIIFFYGFFRKKIFYDSYINNLNNLDQKYLITEVVTKPNFLEGEILYNSLYEIDKSMNEKINSYKYSLDEFEDYIEMWIHEVKVPLSNLVLINHNKNEKDLKTLKEIKRIEDYVEQILYYARSENVEKDYLIKKYDLKKIVNKVILKNKEAFIYKKVSLQIKKFDYKVLTDSKWLQFIINQIINNSLKYCKENAIIEIDAEKKKGEVVLSIYDNGIGIKQSDIYEVFNKSFTGQNGRATSSSTGMGLYICQKLCAKLGHKITIESKYGEYTKVNISFNENEFYDVLKKNTEN